MIKNSMALTEKESETYDFLIKYFKENGYAPSYNDIAQGLGLSSMSSVIHRLNRLCVKGKIVMKNEFPRAIKLVDYSIEKKREGITTLSDIKIKNEVKKKLRNQLVATNTFDSDTIEVIMQTFNEVATRYIFTEKNE